MSSKYILARAKDEKIRENGACGGAVSGLFQYLLDEKEIDGILTLTKGEDVYDGIPALITESSEIIETCGSLHCAPTMVGDLISRFLSDLKVGVAVKPCDAMAINELEKRNQIDPEKVYQIGLNCGGTLMPQTAKRMIELFYEVDPADVIKEEIDKGQFIVELKDGTHKSVKIDDLEEEGYGRRENCQRCELMVPRNADVACGNWGSEDEWTFIEINTPKGEKLVEDAKNKGYVEIKTPSDKLIGIREKVEGIMIKLAQKFQGKLLDAQYPSIEKWDEYWGRCIKCYGCRDVCPVCWCRECELEKEFYQEDGQTPPDPLTFQGVRLSHMAFSCVNCGQCEDVCPMEIPVSKIYDKIQKKYREKTGYVAGVSDEMPPLYSPEKE
ncbi:Coenzyme F420 hydrogenase/dehydrogenase, beta subunit C-terminal domain [Methanobacterium alcaliphilum]|uniref:Coenzyme F420 hydrogenase/dehydrogenase, beta subunit C-terminal domain n=1 Tax=Methanobacterium alcaliphilum TaxID=392018 RepID=UPI00200B587F|nr:Coenzyme F420 hydrogenase/dehydrogenase, beta subunit C-terminal domain [Methanobacterium alcaliphilum]MCK9152536.1 Coenzyme F420 hydrogenase/dehydrogenase, beta subunit C-terminal domain [Methanobacterium alcaliphilum]